MEAALVLRDEHDGVLIVLTQLDRAVDAAAQGTPIPADLFADIQEFFSVFVDRCHHTKEEAALFPLLEGGAHAELAHHLEAEHERGRKLAAAYAEAVRAYTPGDAATGRPLSLAAHAYAKFLRDHIEEEARDLFPVIAAELTADDAHLVAEFERIEEEQIGPGTHERLHGMIDTLPGRIDPFLA